MQLRVLIYQIHIIIVSNCSLGIQQLFLTHSSSVSIWEAIQAQNILENTRCVRVRACVCVCVMLLTPRSTIFQKYRFIDEGNRSTRRKSTTCRKSLTNFITKMLYREHLAWEGFELTTLVVICADCIIMTTTAPL